MNWQRTRRLARLVAGDDNPLRRGVDRAEALIMLVLLAAALALIPLAAVVSARMAGSAASHELRAERSWRQVPAVLQEGASAGVLSFDGPAGSSWVRVSWQQAGRPHTGDIAVSLAARKGDRVMIWVTSDGQLAHPPLSKSDVGAQEAAAALTTSTGVAFIGIFAALGTHLVANRRRMSGWARDWALAGPRWNSLR